MNRKVLTGIAVSLVVLSTAILANAPRGRDEGLAPADTEAAKILTQLRQEHGFVPKALCLMGAREGLLSKFMVYGKGVLEGGPLSDKERSLVALAAAVALKSPECTAAHRDRARQAGASQDEIVQATLIAGLISNTSALHIAHDSLQTQK